MRPRIPKTKTFDGCWTCRRRKVKCNGPRPECGRCAKAGLACDGFGTKLCWITDSASEAADISYRQRIAIPRGNSVLSCYDESVSTRMLSQLERALSSLVDGVTAVQGPFSVFQAYIEQEDHSPAVNHGVNVAENNNDSIIPLTAREEPGTLVLVKDNSAKNGDTLPSPNLSFSPSSQLIQTCQTTNPRVNDLFSHYLLRVTDLNQVIDHPQNIFRSIYAQYAMQAWTQSLSWSVPQATLSSYKAIFCSIVSTAAFHIRGPGEVEHSNWNFYNRIGMVYRTRALQYMQEAIMDPCQDTESYCAKLSAMLTLADTDVMEGSLGEFFAHLEGCHLVRRLRVIHSPQQDLSHPRIRQLEVTSIFMDTIALTTCTNGSSLLHFPSYFRAATLLETPFAPTDTFLEHTYGVTTSIASMIYSINKIWLYVQSLTKLEALHSREINNSLIRLAEQLETWTPLSEDYASVTEDGTTNMSLLKSLSTSFYYATRIYFHVCFRFRSYNYDSMATQLSDQTLMALEQAELARSPSSKFGAPLSWPAFVAACNAPPFSRSRWRRYWQTLLKHKIGGQQAAFKIVEEVWQRKESRSSIESNEKTILASLHAFEVTEPSWLSVIRGSGSTVVAL